MGRPARRPRGATPLGALLAAAGSQYAPDLAAAGTSVTLQARRG